MPAAVRGAHQARSPAAGREGTVDVSFDVNFPGDRTSRVHADASNKLFISYREHPQKDGIRLVGETQFPNLVMSLAEGAFGCVLNDTQSSLTLTLSNPSAVARAPTRGASRRRSRSAPTLAGRRGGVRHPADPRRARGGRGGDGRAALQGRHRLQGRGARAVLTSSAGRRTSCRCRPSRPSRVQALDRTPSTSSCRTTTASRRRSSSSWNTGRVALSWSVDKGALSRKNVVEVLPLGGNIAAGEKVEAARARAPRAAAAAHRDLPPPGRALPAGGRHGDRRGHLPAHRAQPAARQAPTSTRPSRRRQGQDRRREGRGPAEKLGLPPPDLDAPLVELDTGALCKEISAPSLATCRPLVIGGRADLESAALSREEFRVLALSVLGERECTAAASNGAFAELTRRRPTAEAAEEGEDAPPETKEDALASTQTSLAPLPVAALIAKIRPPAPRAPRRPPRRTTARSPRWGSTRRAASCAATASRVSVTSRRRPARASQKGDARAMASEASSGRYRVFVDSDVDVEAERLALAAYATRVLETHGDPSTARRRRPRGRRAAPDARLDGRATRRPGAAARAAAAAAAGLHAGDVRARLWQRDQGQPEEEGLQAQEHAGWQPISFDIDKNAISPYGFRVEPDKVVKLPGLPEPETMEFTVTFASKATKVGLGPLTQELRLDLKPGPPVAIIVKANVTVPELKLSTEAIDFGDVVVGRCYTYTVLCTTRRRSSPSGRQAADRGRPRTFRTSCAAPRGHARAERARSGGGDLRARRRAAVRRASSTSSAPPTTSRAYCGRRPRARSSRWRACPTRSSCRR